MPGTNIFGPHGPGINEVFERPPQTDSNSSTDSWFGPCIDGDPNTGTKVSYRWLNFMTANMREAVRGMGVTESEVDDQLLLKCFQSVTANFSLSALMNMPFFPEIQNSNGLLTFATSAGQIVINTGLSFLHRGHKVYSTGDFSAGERTFATAANKTYHLRWYPPGHANAPSVTYPKGRFMLQDISSGGYNPGAAAETVVAFDTTYDDMLIARVVTNGANALTVTSLVNKHVLRSVIDNEGAISGTVDSDKLRMATSTYNWARVPSIIPAWKNLTVASQGAASGSGGFSADDVHDHDDRILIDTLNRYSWTLNLRRDYAYQMDVRVFMSA